MAKYRTEGRAKALVVTGCLAQRYQEEIRQEIQEVDAVLGTASYDEIADALMKCYGECLHRFRISTVFLMWMQGLITTGGAYEYLKIAEGCESTVNLLYHPASAAVAMATAVAAAVAAAADSAVTTAVC